MAGPIHVVTRPPPVGILGKSGTLTTPRGPITWTQSSDGSIEAEGGGQKVTASGHDESDGSWQKHAEYAETGEASYLTMKSVGEVAEHKVEFTLSSGASRLTLMVADIDARVTSGTAILSGTWNGAAVHWTGHADLTSNPLVSRPIAGWPAGAFATELPKAAFFAPLGDALARTVISPPPATTSRGGLHHMESTAGVLGRAGAWCVGGAIMGAKASPPTVLLGCAVGGASSLVADLVTWLDDDGPTGEPPPPIDFPPTDPEPIGPVTDTQPDDPPPPESGDGGGSGGGEGEGGDGGDGGEGDGGDEGGGGGRPEDWPPRKED
jgi:uncharacterized membrane protein YgcG